MLSGKWGRVNDGRGQTDLIYLLFIRNGEEDGRKWRNRASERALGVKWVRVTLQ